ITIDNDHFTQIKNSHNLTVEGESRTLVKQDTTSIVEGSLHQKIAQLHAFEIGNELHIKAGTKVVIEAGSELTLKAGGSFIKADASGVSLVGPNVSLNSGGSASTGSGFAGKVAQLPLRNNDTAPLEKTDETSSTNVTQPALLRAEGENVSTVKACPVEKQENAE
ncbi:type VI secretion system tip protein VgrG, partial [Vibrio sinaloensis]|nr:type VI secretion system tip protein VgrG [Vibrio sinaloensis]